MTETLHPAAALCAATDWWLVARLPDDRHPEVWVRHPVAAFTVADGRLVPILADGRPHPLRPAVEGRDGEDHLQRTDSIRTCTCDRPVLADGADPGWCMHCTGMRRGVL
jgi:hypothetical protein